MSFLRLLFISFIATSAACSASRPVPETEQPPGAVAEAPDEATRFAYRARIRHPETPEISSARALFTKPGAPELSSLEKCDFDYRVETMLSRSIEELLTTLPEHVRSDPEKYHWCFYAKMVELEDTVTKMAPDGSAAQRAYLLTRYRFFVYLARIFEVDLEDTRYLDFARYNYRRLIATIPESE